MLAEDKIPRLETDLVAVIVVARVSSFFLLFFSFLFFGTSSASLNFCRMMQRGPGDNCTYSGLRKRNPKRGEPRSYKWAVILQPFAQRSSGTVRYTNILENIVQNKGSTLVSYSCCNNHKFSDSKQHRFITSQFWRSEVQNGS